jgi:hypothetical protein
LERLRLEDTAVDDRAVKTLSAMTSLRTLALSRSKLSRDGIAAIRKALPKVKMVGPPAPSAKAVAVHGAIRIKAGSASPVKDSSGNVWQAELGFDGGGRASRDAKLVIANTKDPGLYRSEHYGMKSFSCDAPNGSYLAKLHFAETDAPVQRAGQRIFSFNVQGHDFKDFDVWNKAGGANRAYVETVPVKVTNGKFKITFTKKIEAPVIDAIELDPQEDSAPAVTPATAPGPIASDGKRT